MPLGMEVDLGPDHIVLDGHASLGPGDIVLNGEPALPKRGHSTPTFWPMSTVTKRLGGSRCHLIWR